MSLYENHVTVPPVIRAVGGSRPVAVANTCLDHGYAPGITGRVIGWFYKFICVVPSHEASAHELPKDIKFSGAEKRSRLPRPSHP